MSGPPFRAAALYAICRLLGITINLPLRRCVCCDPQIQGSGTNDIVYEARKHITVICVLTDSVVAKIAITAANGQKEHMRK